MHLQVQRASRVTSQLSTNYKRKIRNVTYYAIPIVINRAYAAQPVTHSFEYAVKQWECIPNAQIYTSRSSRELSDTVHYNLRRSTCACNCVVSVQCWKLLQTARSCAAQSVAVGLRRYIHGLGACLGTLDHELVLLMTCCCCMFVFRQVQ